MMQPPVGEYSPETHLMRAKKQILLYVMLDNATQVSHSAGLERRQCSWWQCGELANSDARLNSHS